MTERIPPQSLDAEMAVLGAAMSDRDALEAVVDTVTGSDFYAHVHESIFAAIVELYAAGRPVDKLSVAERLRDLKKLEHVGSIAYLNQLLAGVTTPQSAEYFAQIVREKALLRDLIRAGSQIAELGYSGEADVDATVSRAESAFSAAVDRGIVRAGGISLYEALWANYTALQDVASGKVISEAVLTPWIGLNDRIGPTMPGEMVIWPAAAASGKSAMLFQLADFLAAHYGQVALFSLEMSERAASMRYAAMYGAVSAKRQRSGDLDARELGKIAQAAETQKSRPIQLFDLTSVSRLADIRRELRLLSKRGRLRAICIDGIQFLGDVDAVKGEKSTTNDRLDFVYRSLIRFAKEFGAIVHAVQHVNREGMSGLPTLKDIRGGGNPEGHAHAIVAPYRPTPNSADPDERRKGSFVVLKSREGGAGPVDGMEFLGHRSMWLEGGKPPWFEAGQEEQDAPFDEYFGAIA